MHLDGKACGARKNQNCVNTQHEDSQHEESVHIDGKVVCALLGGIASSQSTSSCVAIRGAVADNWSTCIDGLTSQEKRERGKALSELCWRGYFGRRCKATQADNSSNDGDCNA